MKTLKRVFPLMMLVAVISCSPVKVVTDLDKSIDFSKYETYSFLGWQENSNELMSQFDQRRVRDAFVAELEARGLRYVEKGGDIDISLFIVLDQKTSTSAYTDYYGTHGYGHRRYGGWGMGHSTTRYSEHDYIVGTLVMDVFDAGTKDQIWQGVASATVDQNPDRREKSIPNKINKLMNEFPVEPMT